MYIYTTFVLLLSLLYAILILSYVIGWHRLKSYIAPSNPPSTTVAVIVPARDEAEYIENCLLAILHQKFPLELLELIVIDDHSTDETPVIVEQLMVQYPQIRLLKLAELIPEGEVLNAYKKKAIETAIRQTQQELIITTDADGLMGHQWLHYIVSYYEQHQAKLIAAPVSFIGEKTFFQRFQTLDFFGMIISTGASIYFKMANMCNGANLCYTKAAFEEVGGFKGIDDIASGDDMLLMAKIAKKYPNDIHFVKALEASVFTYPQPDVAAFSNQRLRWASKSTKYEDKRITVFLGAVFLFNLSFPLSFLGGLFYSSTLLTVFCYSFLIKCIVDFLYLGTGCQFFQRKELLWLFLPAQPIHILYILIIGTLGNFGTYSWKGRKVR